jgi:acyl carrier protein
MGSNADPKLTDALRAGLVTAISEVFDSQVSDLRDDLPLGDLDGWDSMNAVNLTLELESAFGVELAGVILTADQTIADVLELLRERGAAGSG